MPCMWAPVLDIELESQSLGSLRGDDLWLPSGRKARSESNVEAAASPGWYCPHSFYVLPSAGTAESSEQQTRPWLPALGNGDRNAGLGRPAGPSYCLQELASRLRGWSRRLLGGPQSPDFFRLVPGQQARTWLGCAWNSGPTKTSL